MSYMERTLIIVKPEGVQRGLIGNVLTRFERRGLTIVGLKLIHITPELAENHYGVHKGKPFYEGLVKHITSGPVVVGVLEGPKAISVVRTTMGATNAAEALPGTIRGDYALRLVSTSFTVQMDQRPQSRRSTSSSNLRNCSTIRCLSQSGYTNNSTQIGNGVVRANRALC